MGYNTPEDLLKYVRELEKRIEKLERAPRAVNSSVDSGTFTIVSPDTGLVVALFGQLPVDYNRLDGTPQSGLLFFREDGSLAAILGDLNPTIPPFKQSWQVLDRGGNIVFADDTNSGQGVALPWLSWPNFVSNSAPTDTTTSATFVTVQTCQGYKTQPDVQVQVLVRSDTVGTTGEVRVVDQANNVLGLVTVGSAEFFYQQMGPVSLPGAFHDSIVLSVQVRRTAGTGTIGARGIYAIGLQS